MLMDTDIDTGIHIDKDIKKSITEAEYVLFCMNSEERRWYLVFSSLLI